MVAEKLPIGVLSRRTGCGIETIRFYGRAGVLPAPRRHGRYRIYGTGDGARPVFGRRASDLDFTIEGMRTLLGLAASNNEVSGDVRELAAGHLAKVRAKLAGLRGMERVLAEAAAQCDAGQQARCPLIDALSDASPVQPARARARKE
ncbi:MAG: transcriptional regulator [Rhodospirillales bacterium 70-18]|nr:MAG: transcriptional regulator [Rhodospirillales bacterium 70-18]